MTTREMIEKELPEPLKTLALENMDRLPLLEYMKPATLHQAICWMFSWARSNENYTFWNRVDTWVPLNMHGEPPDATPYLPKPSRTHQEIVEQAKAFAAMHGDLMDNIERFAAEFRDIINAFEAEFGREPSADDLLWIASEHHGKDLRREG